MTLHKAPFGFNPPEKKPEQLCETNTSGYFLNDGYLQVSCECGRNHRPVMPERIGAAREAIQAHKTRGRFILANTSSNTSWDEYQNWSDAYSLAMHSFGIEF
jgi:hypothetical protein